MNPSERVVYEDGFVIKRSILRLRATLLHIMTVGKLFTHTHAPLSPSSIILNQPKGGLCLCDWDGKGRSGTAMAHSSSGALPLDRFSAPTTPIFSALCHLFHFTNPSLAILVHQVVE